MTDRRQVRVTQPFFDRLDELLPEQRSAAGAPSSTDFLLHEIPAIIDLLADLYESSTTLSWAIDAQTLDPQPSSKRRGSKRPPMRRP